MEVKSLGSFFKIQMDAKTVNHYPSIEITKVYFMVVEDSLVQKFQQKNEFHTVHLRKRDKIIVFFIF